MVNQIWKVPHLERRMANPICRVSGHVSAEGCKAARAADRPVSAVKGLKLQQERRQPDNVRPVPLSLLYRPMGFLSRRLATLVKASKRVCRSSRGRQNS